MRVQEPKLLRFTGFKILRAFISKILDNHNNLNKCELGSSNFTSEVNSSIYRKEAENNNWIKLKDIAVGSSQVNDK